MATTRPVRTSAVAAKAVMAAAEAAAQLPFRVLLASGPASSSSAVKKTSKDDKNADDDDENGGDDVSDSSSLSSSAQPQERPGRSSSSSSKRAESEAARKRRMTGPASSKMRSDDHKRGEDAGGDENGSKRSGEDSVSDSSSIDNNNQEDDDEDDNDGSSSSSGDARGQTTGERPRKQAKRSSSSRHHHRRPSSRSSNGGTKRRSNPYFVLEHDLVKPPHRKTRPIDDGDTIGDAMFFGDDLMFGLTQGDKSRLKQPWPERLRERLVNEAGLRLVMGGLPGRTSRWDDPVLAEAMGSEWCKPQDFNGLYQFGPVFSSHSPLVVVIALGTNDLKQNVRKEAVKAMSAQTFTHRLDLSPADLEKLRWEEREARRAARMMHREQVQSEHPSEQGDVKDEEEEDEEGAEEDDGDEREAEFDADAVARAVGSIALKARRLFLGHCHEGTLRIIVVVPPAINLTPFAIKQGFDAESVRISKQFPEAFKRMAHEFDVRLVSLPSFQNHSWGDGIHPNDQAAGELAEACWSIIAEGVKRRSKPASRLLV